MILVYTFASEWLERKGLQGLGFKAWSMCGETQSLILPSTLKFGEANARGNIEASKRQTT